MFAYISGRRRVLIIVDKCASSCECSAEVEQSRVDDGTAAGSSTLPSLVGCRSVLVLDDWLIDRSGYVTIVNSQH